MSIKILSILIICLANLKVASQPNFLLNGNFEAINTCTEYHAECGVEAWFYLSTVKVQLGKYGEADTLLGNNTLTVYYLFLDTSILTPLIGTILPCHLQKGNTYTFAGFFNAKYNAKLQFNLWVFMGEKFYVPNRPFVKNTYPQSITQVSQLAGTDLFQFQFSFVANGSEKYLTLGTVLHPQENNGKRFAETKKEFISVTLDNLVLTPQAQNEVPCANYSAFKNAIYAYDYRHKEMDYSLFGRGELKLNLPSNDSGNITTILLPPPVSKTPKVVSDTIKLGDVLFDFNKSTLTQNALQILQKTFKQINISGLDSMHIEGHTDIIGSTTQNLQLSSNRCIAVMQWLQKNKGLAQYVITIYPYGSSRPIADNNTMQGRSLNRRVEIIFFRKVEK